MRKPVSKCNEKCKSASDYHGDAIFQFDCCLKAAVRYFLDDGIEFDHILGAEVQYHMDSGFWFDYILGTGVQYFMDAGFQNQFNSERGIRKKIGPVPKMYLIEKRASKMYWTLVSKIIYVVNPSSNIIWTPMCNP